MDIANSYPYDFTRPVDFHYPLPFELTKNTHIEFLEKGNMVEIPVDFIQCMRVRREDLYD